MGSRSMKNAVKLDDAGQLVIYTLFLAMSLKATDRHFSAESFFRKYFPTEKFCYRKCSLNGILANKMFPTLKIDHTEISW